MKNQNKVVQLPPLKRNPEAEKHLVSEILSQGPMALHESLQQVHDLALYKATELDADEITALWYVEQLRLYLLHFSDAVGDTP